MNKIIHLSDLHTGGSRINDNFQVIVDKIIKNMTPPEDYVIVITGDLVDNGFSDSQCKDCCCFLQPLKKANYKILVVPGNHDYGNFGIGVDIGRVKIFKEVFFGNGGILYPKVDFSNDNKIAFLGLDSTEAAFRPDGYTNGSSGKLGEAQLQRLEELLSDERVSSCEKRVVYLHHHPLKGLRDSHKLKDAETFCRLLLKHREKIDAVLFGHNHEGRSWNDWLVGIPRLYDGGTSTQKRNRNEDDFTPHRVMDLSLPPGTDFDADFLGAG